MGTIYAFCWRCQREGGDVISNDCSIHSAHARHICIFYDVWMCVSTLFLECKLIITIFIILARQALAGTYH